MTHPPVLFLDVDGVLNDGKLDEVSQSCLIDRPCVGFLNQILRRTKCKLVICSAWRYMISEREVTLRGFEYLLRTHGIAALGRVLGITRKDIWNGPGPNDWDDRALHIEDWLKEHRSVTTYLVLDDKDLGYTKHGTRHYQTDSKTGLTLNDVLHVVGMLGGKTMIKFGSMHIEDVARGKKTETWRPAGSSAADVKVGEIHWATDPEGRKFAKIEITGVEKHCVGDWFSTWRNAQISAEYGYEKPEDLLYGLERYYPKGSITPDTVVSRVQFRVTEVMPEDYTTIYETLGG